MRVWQGDLADYRRYLLERREGEPEAPASAAKAKPEARRAAAKRRDTLAPLKQTLRAAEQRVAELAARKAALDRQLADPATYAGDAPLQALLRDQAAAAAALAEAEAAWLAAADALERARS